MPLHVGEYRPGSGYRTPERPGHRGIDFEANFDTPIYAMADGWVCHVGKNDDPQGYGSWIVIDHQETLGVDTVYGHMPPHTFTVEYGQRVKAGDMIALVGSEGGSSGPHLHFEVFGRPGRFGGQDMNPLKYLADNGAVDPVDNKPVDAYTATHKVVASEPNDQVRTIFGLDVSNHQNPISLKRAKAEGMEYVFIKATEGTWKDPVFHSHLQDAKEAGLLVCAYHYVWDTGSSIEDQANTIAEHVNDTRIPIALDIEENSGYKFEFFNELREAIERRGYRVPIVYTGKWYWSRIPGWDTNPLPAQHLWLSYYGKNPTGNYRSIYPGDDSAGWTYMAPHQTKFLQYGEHGVVAGYLQGVDVNAFKGSYNELKAIFTGEDLAPHEEAKVEESKYIVTKMQDVTGPEYTGKYDIVSTDLGVMTKMGNRMILSVFGDSFRGQGVGSGEWLSPIGLIGNTDNDRVVWSRAAGSDPERVNQLLQYEHVDGLTKLPGDVLTIGDVTYMHVMVNRGLGNVEAIELYKTENYGISWELIHAYPGDFLQSMGQLWTMEYDPEDEFVYVFTTKFDRSNPIHLFRFKIENPGEIEIWGFDGEWGWGKPLTTIFGGTNVGEMCLRKVVDKWMLVYFDATLYKIAIKILDHPTANVYTAETHDLIYGTSWGMEDDNHIAQLYGPSIVPGATLDEFSMFVSQWNTEVGWPYKVMQFKVKNRELVEAPETPKEEKVEEVVETPESPENKDENDKIETSNNTDINKEEELESAFKVFKDKVLSIFS